MRSLEHRSRKKNDKCRVNKKKISRGGVETWNYSREIPLQNLEDVNEIIRMHRKQRTISKGSWKIMPKDSCEVYKERKKRQVDTERSENVEERSSMIEVEDNNVANKKRKYKKKVLGKKSRLIDKRLRKKKQNGSGRKRRHRCRSCSLSHSTTSVCSLCTSYSEMDYE